MRSKTTRTNQSKLDDAVSYINHNKLTEHTKLKYSKRLRVLNTYWKSKNPIQKPLIEAWKMGRINISTVLIICIMFVCTLAPCCCSKKPDGVARKEDIPYIKCGVCQKLANQLYYQVQSKQQQISPKKVIFLYLGLYKVCNFVDFSNWGQLFWCVVDFLGCFDLID